MSDSPAAILFDEHGSPITTVSGIDGVRIGVDADLDLSTLATESTVSGIAQSVSSLDGKDFATETTLAGLATETKLELVRLLLSSIDSKDFATEATVSGIAQTASSLEAKDFATSSIQTDGTQRTKLTDGINDVAVEANRLAVASLDGKVARDEIVSVEYFREGIASTTYLLTIDLNNGSGDLKHTNSGGLVIYGGTATLVKSATNADWRANVGVVLDITASDITIGWLEMFSLHAEDSGVSKDFRSFKPYPIPIELKVPLSKMAITQEVTTDLTDSISIEDLNMNSYIPEIGDLITRLTKESGTGTATIHQSIWYKAIS